MLSRRLLRIKVVKALFAHLKSGADNMIASEKNLMASVDKAYDLYFQIITLPVELARYAEQRQELAKQKKLPTPEDLNPNTKFVDNAVIRTIANSDAVNDHVAARKLGWSQYPELIRTLFTQLSESEYYKEYMARRSVRSMTTAGCSRSFSRSCRTARRSTTCSRRCRCSGATTCPTSS